MEASNTNSRVVHTGTGGEYFVIMLVNFLLTVFTLGIYSFWAKARRRRYLWSHTSFDGEQFEYDGTGLETFVGFLKATGIMLVLGAAFGGAVWFLFSVVPVLAMVVMALAYLFLVLVLPFAALFGAQRYQLSRTRLRGVRFALTGSAIKYGFTAFGQTLLVGLTLGLYAPFASMKLHRYRTEHAFYGSEQLQFNGKGKEVFASFFIAWLLTLPTLGLIWLWYVAKVSSYKARHTCLNALRFDTTFTGGQLFWMMLSNLLIVVFTLGLGAPWAVVRAMRFQTSHTVVNGELDWTTVKQAAEKASATNEGFADALDVSYGI